MRNIKIILFLLLSSTPVISFSGHVAKDAAIGGGVGGAAGGMIGAEAGGRNGAIIGSAAGAAIGSAILTKASHDKYAKHHDRNDDDHYKYTKYHDSDDDYYRHKYKKHKKYKKCPPGLAMQGKC